MCVWGVGRGRVELGFDIAEPPGTHPVSQGNSSGQGEVCRTKIAELPLLYAGPLRPSGVQWAGSLLKHPNCLPLGAAATYLGRVKLARLALCSDQSQRSRTAVFIQEQRAY